ncbi:glycosyltransferase family 2 protein [Methylobacterium nodulans]|uniref:Glycosyl transferase family 2 n=1 Tax=Methylobacterium nodulans (strain LMG 21967 / CNCM I-2342 / ORS 2060) TaxID=460265 RepID=B8ISS0_METNO|nr:glycosyltransferase family 2 protein [Methylobacterium nodulans]ACL60719.1 glycosyl transferase family 2 [Methylobacterium nodulans ORS 2060]
MTEVAVAIVGFRCAEAIASCLDHLDRSTYPVRTVRICENGGEAAFDALVARLAERLSATPDPQPGSGDRIDRIVRLAVSRPGAIGEIVLHRAVRNLGYAGAINALLDALAPSPDWSALWILNPDTEPAPDALRALTAHAARGPYGIVGSRLIVKHSGRVQLYGGRWRRWLGRGYNIGLGAPAEAAIDPAEVERTQHYVSGAAMYVSRDFVRAVGPMNEDYFLYAEEVDWCLRRGSFRLGYAHDAVVVHDHGATIGSNLDRRSRSAISVFLDERSRLLLTRRFFPGAFPVAAAATLLLTLQYVRAGAVRNFGVALAGWWAGLCGRTGMPAQLAAKSG